MTILDLTREQIAALIESKLMNKNAIKHYDVCKEIAKGRPQNSIAEDHGYAESAHIRWIHKNKCPECPEKN